MSSHVFTAAITVNPAFSKVATQWHMRRCLLNQTPIPCRLQIVAQERSSSCTKTAKTIMKSSSSTLHSASSLIFLSDTRHLLSLPRCKSLGLGQLLLPPGLRGLSTSLGIEAEVPPPEAAGVVANELLVVNIVMLRASPERKDVVQAPGELVTTVRINGLEQTEGDPAVHGQDVEVLGDGAPEDGASDATKTEDHDFNGRSVLSGQTERRGVLMVDLVDVLVKE